MPPVAASVAQTNFTVFNKLFLDKAVTQEFPDEKLLWKVSRNSQELIRDGVQFYKILQKGSKFTKIVLHHKCLS